MKTAIQIGALVLAMLVLTLAPIRTRISRVVEPAVQSAEHAVQQRFPALIALHSLWRANSDAPRRPQSCGRGPFSAC